MVNNNQIMNETHQHVNPFFDIKRDSVLVIFELGNTYPHDNEKDVEVFRGGLLDGSDRDIPE